MSSVKTRLKKLSGKNKVSDASDSDQEYHEDNSTEEKTTSEKGGEDNSSDFSEGDDVNEKKEKNWNSQKKSQGPKVCEFPFFFSRKK